MTTPGPQTDAAERLLAECLEHDESDWASAVDAACAAHPASAAALRARFAQLVAVGVVAGASPQPDLPHGLQFGDYRLEAVIGRGATATVYRAFDATGRVVALKILRGGLAASGRWTERFAREVRLASGLVHAGLCRVLGSGDVRGEPYLAMELVEGRTLAAEFAAGAPLPRLLGALEQAARALAHAHRHGLVHRDVKPANVLVRGDGSAVLTDLGLALASDDEQELTATETVVGSPAYLAPELVAGTGRGSVASDVYALGCCLHECVTGRLPFSAPTRAALFAQILAGARVPLSGDPGLRRIVDTAMARAPAHRYASADAFADDLARVLGGRPPLAQRASLRRRATDWVVRNRAAAAVILALGLGGTLAAAGLLRSESLNATLRAMARRAAAGEALDDDAELAIALAAAAHRDEPDASSRSLLYQALATWHPWRLVADGGGGAPGAAPPISTQGGGLVWLRDGRAIALAGSRPSPAALAVAPGDRCAAAGHGDGVVHLWDPDGAVFGTIATPSAALVLAFSRDGRLVAVGGGDGIVRIHLVDRSGCAEVASLKGHRALIEAVSFSGDGKRLASSDADGERRSWDVEPSLARLWHPGRTPLIGVAPLPGTRTLLMGQGRTAVAVEADGVPVECDWLDVAAPSVLGTAGHVLLQQAPGVGTVVRLGDGVATPWHRGAVFASLAAEPAEPGWFLTSERGVVQRWDRRDGAFVHGAELVRRSVDVTALAVSRDGARFACGDASGVVAVFAADGSRVVERALHRDHVWHVAFRADGAQLVTASRDETVWLGPTDLAGGVVLEEHAGTVLAAAFSPPEQALVATGSVDGTARLWRTDGTPFAVLRGHRGQVEHVAFTPDGEVLLTAGSDGAVRRWPIGDARLLRLADAAPTPVALPERYRVLLGRR